MQGRARAVAFLVASFIGSLLAVIVLQYQEALDTKDPEVAATSHELRSPAYKSWLSELGLERVRADSGSTNEARLLYERVPVLCLVHARSEQQTRSVLNTWSRRCNHVVFFGSLLDPYVPIEQVPRSASDAQVACTVFRRVLKKYGGTFSWLLLVDDETFAVVENLRFYVASLNASEVYYLGHPVRDTAGAFYNTLQAGIALSEGAVRALRVDPACAAGAGGRATSGQLDRHIGQLLRPRSVPPVDSRDPLRRGRFNPFNAEKMLVPGSIPYTDPYWRSSLFLSPQGGRCCSRRAITFHGTNPVEMYLYEYLVYGLHTHPGGTSYAVPPTRSPPSRNVPMELTNLLKGRAFIRPQGIGIPPADKLFSA